MSPTEIGAQLPFTVSGAVPLTLQTPGGASASFLVNVQSQAPAIFHTGLSGDQTGLATVVRAKNNDLVTFTNPIHPRRDDLHLSHRYGCGDSRGPGRRCRSVRSARGGPRPSRRYSGTTPLPVLFAGLAPVRGLSINAYVPHGVADAAETSLTVAQGSASTAVLVRVVNP